MNPSKKTARALMRAPRFAALVLVAATLATACLMSRGSSEEHFTVDVALEADVVHVDGLTTLIDGSLVSCEVWHESEDHGFGPGTYITLTSTTVINGAFSCRPSVEGWPEGSITIAVVFDPSEPEQPDQVVQTYGRRGQGLAGPQATSTSDGRVLQVVKRIPG